MAWPPYNHKLKVRFKYSMPLRTSKSMSGLRDASPILSHHPPRASTTSLSSMVEGGGGGSVDRTSSAASSTNAPPNINNRPPRRPPPRRDPRRRQPPPHTARARTPGKSIRREYQLLRSQTLLLAGTASLGLILFLLFTLPVAALVGLTLMVTSLGACVLVTCAAARTRYMLEMQHPLGLVRYLPENVREHLTEKSLHDCLGPSKGSTGSLATLTSLSQNNSSSMGSLSSLTQQQQQQPPQQQHNLKNGNGLCHQRGKRNGRSIILES